MKEQLHEEAHGYANGLLGDQDILLVAHQFQLVPIARKAQQAYLINRLRWFSANFK